MLIVITLPDIHQGEAAECVRLLLSGVDLIHIRKPHASAQEVEQLILDIPETWRHRLVVHDHFELAERYHLHGVHLNSRNPQPPTGWKGSVSRSCHTVAEVAQWKPLCDYVSLSPIFDSISKQGYHSAFTPEDILRAHEAGIIDRKVMALGGVTFSKMDDMLRMGFGGGMILGDAWHSFTDSPLQPVALTIAGSDPSGGAGIQQDMKTMHAMGAYCGTVITALTSQNTLGVQQVMSVPADVVASQLDSVLADLNVRAIKIGMIPNTAVAEVIADKLEAYKRRQPCAVVYDPVMISTSGKRLMEEDCLSFIKRRLLPLCTLVTPNIPETRTLMGTSDEEKDLCQHYGCAFLVKGGHGEGKRLTDRLYLTDGTTHDYTADRIPTNNLHGTGCTLSSAIAASMLLGHDIETAVDKGRQQLLAAIAKGKNAHIGHGNGPVIV